MCSATGSASASGFTLPSPAQYERHVYPGSGRRVAPNDSTSEWDPSDSMSSPHSGAANASRSASACGDGIDASDAASDSESTTEEDLNPGSLAYGVLAAQVEPLAAGGARDITLTEVENANPDSRPVPQVTTSTGPCRVQQIHGGAVTASPSDTNLKKRAR
jgi:hypothetical protein